jgi:hypothetical protein
MMTINTESTFKIQIQRKHKYRPNPSTSLASSLQKLLSNWTLALSQRDELELGSSESQFVGELA